jgi:hypothetical protein
MRPEEVDITLARHDSVLFWREALEQLEGFRENL